MGELIEYASNGDKASGYLAVPASGDGPGVVVIQEWWGLVPHITDVADRFAAEDFVALAPDLYNGKKTTEPDEAGKEMMALQFPKATRDMSGAVDELLRRSSSNRVGVVGFCMGGGLAIVLAAARPDAVSVCVPFYGLIPWSEAAPDYAAIEASILGHYAENDAFFTPEAARALEQELSGLGKEVRFEIYEGAEHAFFNDTRPEVYDAEASAVAWKRTIDLLHSKLG
jgi:carboxymethylenebutenolidase